MIDTSTDLLNCKRICRYLHIFFFLLISCSLLDAQSGVQWSNNYGGSSNDIPHAMQKTANGGFIIAGQSASSDIMVSTNYGGYDAWVIELDAFGNLVWEKNYGGSKEDYITGIQATSDGGYIIIGGSFSTDNDLEENLGKSDVWVLKIDAEGEKEWTRTYGGTGVDFGTSIQQTSDNGFIIAACTSSAGENGLAPGAGGNDVWVIKTDEIGEVEWQKIYGGSRYDGPKKILQTTDGGYLIGGNTWSKNGDISENNGQSDAFFFKLNATGDLDWSKTFGGITTDRLNDFVATTDGNFVMTGTYSAIETAGTGYGGRYDEDFWLLKFSPTGQEIWEQHYGGSVYDEANSLTETSDGGFLIGGVANSGDGDVPENQGLKDIWVVKTNAAGEIDWTQAFGGEYNEEIIAVAEIATDEFLLVGYSSSGYADTLFENSGLEDWWIMKLGNSNAPIFANLGPDITVCANEDFHFDVADSSCVCNYVWSDGNTTSIRTLSTYITTTYTVTITDQNGFSVSDEIVVNISDPEVIVNATQVDCYGQSNGSIDLVPMGNYSYEWENGMTTEDRSDLLAGTYVVTITDAFNCAGEQIISIAQPFAIALNETVSSINCFGDNDGSINLNPTGGTGNFEYNWNQGATTQDLSGLSVGTYTVTLTDANNCSTTNSWTITEPDQLSIGLVPIIASCYNSEDGQVQIAVNGGTGELDYTWSNGSTEAQLNNVAAGTYTVTVVDESFCEATANVTIGSPTEISIDETIVLATCSGNNDGGIVTISSGGVGAFQYLWNTGATTPDLNNIMAGTYTLTVTDDNMCQQIEEFVVSQNTNLAVSSGISQVSCYEGNDGAIILTPSGGVGTYEFNWSNGATSQNIADLTAGDYIVTVMDDNNCQEIQQFTVNAPDEILIHPIVTAVSCYGGSDGAISVDVTGGTGEYVLAWSGGVNTELSADTYTISVTDENACEAILDINVPQPDSLFAALQVVQPVTGNDGMITATGVGGTSPYDFVWNDGALTGDQLPNLSGGLYELIMTDDNGCVFEVTILLETVGTNEIENLQAFEIYPNPSDGQFYIQLGFDQKEEVNVLITNELGQTVRQSFLNGNTLLENVDLSNISAGMYFVSIKTEKGTAVKRVVLY